MIEKGLDLKIPPHVFPQLMNLFFDETQLPYPQEAQLLAHLSVCQYCRLALKTLLVIVNDYDQKNDASNVISQELLERFIQIDDEIDTFDAHRIEHLAAYAEAVVEHGEIEANLRFQEVATHIESCQNCRSTIESTIAFLEAENTSSMEEDTLHDGP